MIELLFGVMLLPASAAVAGGVVWARHRGDEMDDSSLFWAFMVPLAVVASILFGLARSDTVRMKVDPVYKLQTELDAHPVYAALKRFLPDDHGVLHKALMADGLRGAAVPTMFVTARPVLAEIGRQRLPWAEPGAKVAWGQIYVDTLAELLERSPEACIEVLARTTEGNRALMAGLSAANTKAFERGFVDLVKSADKGMGDRPRRSGRAGEFNDAGRQWRLILDAVKDRYGPVAGDIVRNDQFAATPLDLKTTVCSARIMQLSLILEQPEPTAAALVDSALR